MPVYEYADFDSFQSNIPHGCQIIGVELLDVATPLSDFIHPERAIYLLGAEDHGLSKTAIANCHKLVVLPGEYSLNVSVAGSIVLYDRIAKGNQP